LRRHACRGRGQTGGSAGKHGCQWAGRPARLLHPKQVLDRCWLQGASGRDQMMLDDDLDLGAGPSGFSRPRGPGGVGAAAPGRSTSIGVPLEQGVSAGEGWG
jgi:hypothetical protein